MESWNREWCFYWVIVFVGCLGLGGVVEDLLRTVESFLIWLVSLMWLLSFLLFYCYLTVKLVLSWPYFSWFCLLFNIRYGRFLWGFKSAYVVQIIVIFSAFVSAFYEALHVVMYGYICWVCLVCDSFLFRLVCVLGFCFGWLRGWIGILVFLCCLCVFSICFLLLFIRFWFCFMYGLS